MPPATTGTTGKVRASCAEAVDELVLGAEHDRRPHDRRVRQRRRHRRLARRLGLGIARAARRTRADRGDLDERRDPGRRRRTRNIARAFGLDRRETLLACLREDADQVDARGRPIEGACQPVGVADIPADDLDLAECAERLQERRRLGRAHHDPHAGAGPRQLLHDIAADESRSANDHHQPVHRASTSTVLQRPHGATGFG